MTRAPARRSTWLALAVTISSPGLVHANGRFPASRFVTVGPGPRAERIALGTTFGVVVSVDAGRSWSWLCEELFEYGGPPWDPRLAWGAAPGTPLFVGIPTGLMRTRTLCDAERVPETGRDFSGDVTTTPDGNTVYWAASNGTGTNRVLVSRDGGRSFATAGAVPGGVLPETIEVAGAGARRVYVTGVAAERVVFLRSDDGGERFEELALDLHGGRDAYLAGVDPTNPDVVYLRSSLPEGDGGEPGGTLLLRSTDGGRRFDEVTRTRGPMLGFALSGDGRTIWVGGPEPADRLQRSDDGGRTFTRVNEVRTLCLRWHAGTLYVCAPYVTEGFALGRSTDGGRTVEPVLRFQSLAGPPAACAPATFAGSLCAQRWPAVRALIAPPDTPAMDAGAGPDAGTPRTRDGGDCGCRVGARPGAGTIRALAILAAVALARIARQRRSRAPRSTVAS